MVLMQLEHRYSSGCLDLLGPDSHSWFMVLHNYDSKIIPTKAEDVYKYPDLNCLFIKVLILSLIYKV